MRQPTGFSIPAILLVVMVGALPASCSKKPLSDTGPDGGGGQGGGGVGAGGGQGGGGVDGGLDLPSERGLPFTGQRSYVVTAVVQRDGGVGTFPASHAFTLVLDADRRTAIAGGTTEGIVASFELTGAGALHFNGSLSFRLGGCPGSSVLYSDLTIAIDASDRLTGTGQGQVTVVSGDIGSTAAATMSLTGGPDVQPPTLSVGGDATDPFASLTVAPSEPLPPGASLALRAADGGTIALSPDGMGGSLVTMFRKPARILRYATQYQIATDGITDFAGNAATGGGLMFTTKALPPLAPEDGFESVTGTAFGGVQVLSGTGAPTITGAKSLYVPPTNGFSPTQPVLVVRLPLAAGDTTVSFAYRTVTPGSSSTQGFSYGASWVVGSQGGTIAVPAVPANSGPRTNAMIGAAPVTLGPITTASVALPADAANEVIFQRTLQVPGAGCGLPLPPIDGIIIDDLRVE